MMRLFFILKHIKLYLKFFNKYTNRGNVQARGIRYIGYVKPKLVLYAVSLVDLREESSTWGMKTTPPYGSSEEY